MRFIICLNIELFIQNHPDICCTASTIQASWVLFALRPVLFCLAKSPWLQEPWFSLRCGIFRNYMSRYILNSKGLWSFPQYNFVPSSKKSIRKTKLLPPTSPQRYLPGFWNGCKLELLRALSRKKGQFGFFGGFFSLWCLKDLYNFFPLTHSLSHMPHLFF